MVDGGPDAGGLGASLRLLLAPLDWDPQEWRTEVTRCLKSLVDADAGTCLLWHKGTVETCSDALEPEIVTDYLERFASLDHGMKRRDALGLALWSRQRLWERDTLLRSVYFNEFARPRRLQDTIGVSLDLDEIPAHLRIVLLFRQRPLAPEPATSDWRACSPSSPRSAPRCASSSASTSGSDTPPRCSTRSGSG
jgi:hypothetical protein